MRHPDEERAGGRGDGGDRPRGGVDAALLADQPEPQGDGQEGDPGERADPGCHTGADGGGHGVVEQPHGPRAGLELLTDLGADRHLSNSHRLHAVRAHLLEQAGDRAAARAAFEEATRRATSIPEKRYLQSQSVRLTARGHTDP